MPQLTERQRTYLLTARDRARQGLAHGAPAIGRLMGISESTAQRLARDLRLLGLVPVVPPGDNRPIPLQMWPELPEGVVEGAAGETPAPVLGSEVQVPRACPAPEPAPLPPPHPLADPTEETQALRRQLTEARRLHQEYREDQGEIRTILHELVEHVQVLPPPAMVYHRPQAGRVSTPIALVVHNTDWHMGAVQDRDEIEGFNAFSPAILRQRIHTFAADVLDWTALHRHAYDVDVCHVLVTGDLISGDIHDELRVTNAWPAPVQAVEAGRLLAEEVSLLSPHFARVAVDLITADNHGRLTKKPQHKQGGYNTFNYPLAVLAETLLAAHRNVEVCIHPKEQTVVEVKGRHYLICHGHQVMGWAGFPYYGLQRKVGREATKRMRAELGRFDRIVCGHWHAPLAAPDYWIGGSASGTDAYDHSAGRESLPIQCAWFVHPRHGEFDRTDWYLREDAA